jgi:putative aldouronate transport system permease protein
VRIKKISKDKLKPILELFSMLLPGLILVIIFKYVPMYGLTIAFKDYSLKDGIMASPWVGLDNFRKVFQMTDFWSVVKNTVWISVLKLMAGFPAPIIFALMLNEVRKVTYKKAIQTVSYLPHFFSWVTLSGVLLIVFNTNGVVNEVLQFLGMDKPIPFLTSGKWFIGLLVGSAVWKDIGWGSIIYLAAIAGISPTLYEAATVDGASRWKQIIHITIPSILPTITVMLILRLGTVMEAGFDQVYNMYNPLVYEVSDIINTYVLRRIQSMDFTLGTVVGMFKSVISLVLVLTTNSIARKLSKGEQGLW